MRRSPLLIASAALLGALPGSAPAIAAGERTIAVVVDFGAGEGLPPSFTLCVKEPPGATDAEALADALADLKRTQPSYSSSGLLCSIAGYPAAGCGTPTPSGYSYWAYFHGGVSSWTYASDGPAEHTASPATAEGWRYESNGRGNPSDPPPGGSARAAALCPRSVVVSTTTTMPAVTHTTTVATALSTTPSSSTTTTTLDRNTTTTRAVNVHEASKHVAAGDLRHAASRTSSGVVTGAAVVLLAALTGVGLWLRRRGQA